MRSILPAGCFLVMMVIICGCTQSPPAPLVTPTPAAVPVVTLPDATVTGHLRTAVNVTAEKTQSSVIIRLDGGSDAASLTSLNVRITNYDGNVVQRTIPFPEIKKPYEVSYRGYSNAAKINIVGTFSDGYQQTLLMTDL